MRKEKQSINPVYNSSRKKKYTKNHARISILPVIFQGGILLMSFVKSIILM
jgi:hypothetical protein